MIDIIIVGAGPSGLSVAIEAQNKGLKYLVIEKGGIVNSIQNFPVEMSFFSTPELLEIGNIPFTSARMRPTRAEGLEYYTKVVDHFSLNCNFFEAVVSIVQLGGQFSVKTTRTEYRARKVVLATGYYDNPNLLGVPGEDLPKVSHYYKEPYQYYRQNVMVVGAKNSAAIAALELYRHGTKVTLVHRGKRLSDKIKYWILPDIENRIKERSINAYFETHVLAISEKSVRMKRDGAEFDIDNDFVFILTGYHPDYAFLSSCGIALDDAQHAPIVNSVTLETNVHGIFVAGSIVAGGNNNSIFIENGRLHGKIIIDAVTAQMNDKIS